ncbi:MAG: NAD(P)-binding domain-containing protein [Proteobacteria bacterium]|nr:NAD(P)-binding domain-containing protein [Pseudomonadota bacterium]
MEKITIIGLGNMGAALVRGLQKAQNQTVLPIDLYDVDLGKVNKLLVAGG